MKHNGHWFGSRSHQRCSGVCFEPHQLWRRVQARQVNTASNSERWRPTANCRSYFIENQGQLDPDVSYYIQGRDKSIYFTPAGVTFALRGADPEALEGESPVSSISYRAGSRWTRGASEAAQRWVVKLDFVDANPNVRPVGQEPTAAVISYFTGPREEWNHR